MTSWSTYYQSVFESVVSRNHPKHLGKITILIADAEPLICDPFVLCKYSALNNVIQSAPSPEEAPSQHKRRKVVKPELNCACDILDLSNYKEATVIEMLRFAYLGETEDLTTKISLCEDLVKLGNELQFTELLSCCSAWLESNAIEVTRDSVGRLFDVALAMNCKKMMERCVLRYLLEEELLKQKVEQWIVEKRVDVFEAFFEFSFGFKIEVPNCNGLNNPTVDKADWITVSDNLFHEIVQGKSIHYSDMLVKVSCTIKEVTYHCHRSILSNSKVLKAIIDGNLNETSEKVITITDTQAEVLVEVLRYLYTTKTGDLMQRIDEETHSVFMAELVIRKAHEYDLPELVDKCRATLMQAELTTDNVLRILGIGRLYSLPDIQNRCLQFIYQHRGDVAQHPSFKVFATNDVESVRLAVLAEVKNMDCFPNSGTLNWNTRVRLQKISDMEVNEEITLHTEEFAGIACRIWLRKLKHTSHLGEYHSIMIGLVADHSPYPDDVLKVGVGKMNVQMCPNPSNSAAPARLKSQGYTSGGRTLNVESVKSDKPKHVCFELSSDLKVLRDTTLICEIQLITVVNVER